MTELEAILLLSYARPSIVRLLDTLHVKGISIVSFVNDPESFQREFSELISVDLTSAVKQAKQEVNPTQLIEECHTRGIQMRTFWDAEYPMHLREIHEPPLVLYVKGTLFSEDRAAIAVVGSRHASPYGIRTAHRFAYELAEKGVTIVSGLARGIDSEAHRGALEARGRTIAVLGSGVDMIYPKENEKLYEQIIDSGAVISEFPIGTPPLAYHFPKRNRIIAGCSLATLVVEAHSRSGSLITASLSAEEGREVYSIPGPVDSIQSRGTNRLIKQGAKLALTSDDILEDLHDVLKDIWKSFDSKPEKERDTVSNSLPSELTAEEEQILDSFEGDSLTIDEISLKSGFPPQKLVASLFRLELEGRIEKKPGGFYRLLFEMAKDL
ncbi:MAG: DNA-protecting protein DprA [Candidatus Omnitrophica bacterium]|nr:DNA-protecting protein DprA [Candidatus Omnitrophota bacterium]